MDKEHNVTMEARRHGVTDPQPRAVTLRAVALSCALIPLVSWWMVTFEFIWLSASSSAISLFFHVTFVLVILALVNLWVDKRWPEKAFSPAELLTVYMMLSIAGTFSSHDLIQILIPHLAFPAYYANPHNGWEEYIIKHLPEWSYLSGDAQALSGLAVGNASLYRTTILLAWAKPLAFWFTFLMALMGALLCINVFFRQHWTEKEKLSFPVIQIPIIIATRLDDLMRNRLFWLAFGITATIDIINNISHFYPVIPSIPIVQAFTFRDYFVERPWSAIAFTEVNLYPFVIGLTFFIPTDLAFSCWFFFIVFKLQIVLTSALGITNVPGFPFPNEQAAGAYIALGLLAIWLSRRHLIQVGRSILGLPGGADESREPIRYRTAFIIFVLCCLCLFVLSSMLGASLPVLLIFFLIFFLYSLAIARMRAELGPPAHDLHWMGPEQLIQHAVGTHSLGPGNLTTFSLFFWFNRAYRAHISAHSMEGFKIGQLTRTTSRSILVAMSIAVVVGAVAALWAMLHALYVHGYSGRPAGDGFSSEAWHRMVSWMVFPQRPNVAATLATIGGLVGALLLGALRMRFPWWAWHPVGYAVSSSWSMDKLWFCIFVGWLAKALIVRYGGAQLYRKALPFFVGLVLGEFMVEGFAMIYSTLAGVQVYRFWG